LELFIHAMYLYIPCSHEVRRESQQEEVANRCRIIVLILLLWLLLLLLFSSPSPIRYSYTRNVCYFVFTITKSGGGRAIGPRRVFYDVAEEYELCCNTDHWNFLELLLVLIISMEYSI
jgi:hypothetical protein